MIDGTKGRNYKCKVDEIHAMIEQIKGAFPDQVASPLMHYVDCLIECIRLKDIDCMKKVIGVYMVELNRDGNFIEYQDRIA